MSTRVAVIGAGIIGSAVARRLYEVMDDVEVTVFEKESRVGAHQTGHNSGVVHAGLYYEPGSLKARMCRRGMRMLEEFASTRGIPYIERGKVVVARDAAEMGRLAEIHRRAVANKVPGIRMLDQAQLRQVEPHARGVAALFSPHTAVVDYVGVAKALTAEVVQAGGSINLNSYIDSIRPSRDSVEVHIRGVGSDCFDLAIACTGLQSDRTAEFSGGIREPRIVPFFGDYFVLRPEKQEIINGLIYPVPDPRYPFLGVHLTKAFDGSVTVGPNAFLSLGRESYRRRNWTARDAWDTFSYPGFWRFAARNGRGALHEGRLVLSPNLFAERAGEYVPGIIPGDLTRGPRGIRAQAMNRDGSLVDDFVITGSGRAVHLRNAPSPGATSSLAIAEHLVNIALERSGMKSVGA